MTVTQPRSRSYSCYPPLLLALAGCVPPPAAPVTADAPAGYQVVERQARNPAHGFVMELDAAGPRLAAEDGSWRLELTLSGYGCPGAVTPAAAAAPEVAGGRVEYWRAAGPEEELVEWYLNGPEGLEQGFTLPQPPACARTAAGDGQVALELDLGGNLEASLAGGGDEVRLRRSDGAPALRYAGLRVTDAAGRELPAALALTARRLTLRIDATGADYPVTVDPLITAQLQELHEPSRTMGDLFGASVAVAVDTAVVGSPGTNQLGTAYVYVRGTGTWTLQKQLLVGSGALGDALGTSVALSGNTAVVGDPAKNSDKGAAFVYVRSGTAWSQEAALAASDPAFGARFGGAVSIDGDTAIIGAKNRLSGSARGVADVFVRSAGTWTPQQQLVAGDGAGGDYFGSSVSVSGDTVVVGANGKTAGSQTAAGAAYVYVRSGTTWTEQAKLLASDGIANDHLGDSVSLAGDTVVVGATGRRVGGLVDRGGAYVYVRSGATWTEQAKLLASDGAAGDQLGASVSLSGDLAIGGAPYAAGKGAAYVFVRSGATWTQQAKLVASTGAANDSFGASVSLAGGTGFVGADTKDTGMGAAYVFSVLKGNGDPCADGTECNSGFCVDGTCCADACTIPCRSCANSSGTCLTNVAAGLEDLNASPPCSGDSVCDGLGGCKKAGHQACTTGGECASSVCADGVCCDSECDAPCHYCSGPGHPSPGTCLLVPDGTDPLLECQASSGGVPQCAGKCQGGQCAYPDVGTGCGLCAACDGTGRCTAMPDDDPACEVVACGGLDTACRTYADLTNQRCASLGTCKQPDEPATCVLWTDLPCEDAGTPGNDGGGAASDGGGSSGDGGGGGSSGGGCGCATAPRAGAALVPALLFLGAARRRRPFDHQSRT